MQGEQTQVLITQVTSYIGTQVCLHFLKNGSFKVRGTVRSTKKPERLEALKAALGDLYDQLELVEANTKDQEAIQKASEGCEYVINTSIKRSHGKPQIAKGGAVASETSSVIRTSHKEINITADGWTDNLSQKRFGAYETQAERIA
jgi:uncharacterized protein YbjT (DUF2867 family)